MPTMQFASRSKNRHVHADPSSRAESDELPPCLVQWSIAHQPKITGKQFFVGGESFLEICAPPFFSPFKCELDVRFRLQPRGAYRIRGRQQGDDGGLIVG